MERGQELESRLMMEIDLITAEATQELFETIDFHRRLLESESGFKWSVMAAEKLRWLEEQDLSRDQAVAILHRGLHKVSEFSQILTQAVFGNYDRLRELAKDLGQEQFEDTLRGLILRSYIKTISDGEIVDSILAIDLEEFKAYVDAGFEKDEALELL